MHGAYGEKVAAVDANLILYIRELSFVNVEFTGGVNRGGETYVCREIYEQRSIYRPTGSRTSDYRCLKSADATSLVARALSESDLESLSRTLDFRSILRGKILRRCFSF